MNQQEVSETSMRILLSDGHTVNQDLFNVVREQVKKVIPALENQNKYTLEMLCGDAFWESLSNGDRRTAGRCMVHLIDQNQLSLMIAEAKRTSTIKYQLK